MKEETKQGTKQEIIFVILPEFADWEGAFIASTLNFGMEPGQAKYTVKTLSVTKDPVLSIGGFRVLPDYDLNDLPDTYAGVVLVGGMSWFTPQAEKLGPLVKAAFAEGKLVAGICNASVFLGMQGILNGRKHTSNGLEYLQQTAGEKYTGEAGYLNEQAVRDGNLVTANGTGALEFCREILYALEVDTSEKIEANYQFYKRGLVK